MASRRHDLQPTIRDKARSASSAPLFSIRLVVFLCSIVVYPVIPKGHIIYRLIPSAAHTNADIDETLKAFTETKAKLDAGAYKAEAIPDMANA